MIKIRASMLPSYADCPRRGAAKQWRSIITEMGFTLKYLPPSIGAAIGTGCHEASKIMVGHKMAGTKHNKNDAIDSAIASMQAETVEGVNMDQTTTSINDAEKQIRLLVTAFDNDVLPVIHPVEIETQCEASVTEDVTFSGRFDILQENEEIDDWKFGSKLSYYGSQLGGYSILKKSKTGKSVKQVSIYHLPRTSIKKVYPGTKRHIFDLASCEKAAYYTIRKIEVEMQKFIQTQNPWCFPANPMSMMCSEKYCPAYKTSFCDMVE